MEYEERDFFKEQADPTVPGFTVVETSGSGESIGETHSAGTICYQVAEKWERSDEENTWTTYWISEDELRERVEGDKCEHVGKLKDHQFESVCKQVDERLLAAEA